ncbi:hypothetical protein Droror1_Dr00016602 [Drosera rotundifolia]
MASEQLQSVRGLCGVLIHLHMAFKSTKKNLENVLQAKGASNSKILCKRSTSEYIFYEAYEGDGAVSVVATERSTEYGGYTTFGIGDFGVSRCPDRIAERVSPSDGVDLWPRNAHE